MSCRPLIFVAACAGLALTGCGGSKTDYSAKPVKYTVVSANPTAADSVVLSGVSRDGRVIGTYSKAGVTTFFGWTPDGDPSDLTLPSEIKTANGINEMGAVLGSNLGGTPQKMYRWQNNRLEEIRLPANATVDSTGALTFDSYFLVNLHIGAGKTRGYQLRIDEDPKVWTNDDGRLLGSSLSGNLTGYDMNGALSSAIAVINDQKRNCGLFQGAPTVGQGINDAGVVVGSSRGQAIRWQSGKYSNLAIPTGATASTALDINNEGVICGEATVNGVQEACIWFKAGVFLVKDLTTLPSGVHLERARLVTPLGIVVCEGTRNGKAEVFGLFPEFP